MPKPNVMEKADINNACYEMKITPEMIFHYIKPLPVSHQIMILKALHLGITEPIMKSKAFQKWAIDKRDYLI